MDSTHGTLVITESMSADTLLYIILGILTISFLLEQSVRLLNIKAMGNPIPQQLQDVYEAEKYAQSQTYNRTKSRLSLVVSGITFVVTFLFLLLGGFGWLDELVRTHLTDHPIFLPLVFFGLLYFVSEIISIPLSLYSTFVIEERYGFNKMTKGTWVMDKLKGLVLTIIVGGPLILALLWLINELGANFWLWFWALISVFLLLMNFLYPTLIVPLFNKLTPLEDGELKSAIEAYGRRVDFPLDKVMIMDGSKRSSKGNAYFAGFGKNKRVVLYDTLIEQNTTEELISILAHEVGHYKHKHVPLSFVVAVLQFGFMLFILSLMVGNKELSLALGAEEMGIHLSLIAFGMLYSPISTLLGLGMNLLSRRNEFQADRFATETASGPAMIEALKKLSRNSLSNLTPHPAHVFLHFSHPPLDVRIGEIGKLSD